MSDLTHIGPDGRARMVDVGDKAVTQRTAIARGRVDMAADTLTLATSRDTRKGDPIAIAELAGIMAAKITADLIPLCHPLPLTSVKVDIEPIAGESAVSVTARAKTSGRTGVEMEALTAVSVACLTLYDMLKAVDKAMVIGGIELVEKTGGKSGDYRKGEP
ncbi:MULTISPECIES: cyclic pyranopterin monophosphate synthase MoaC [Henriciella]|uniref:cyclic pyranopterin monophosphate synthase MoaC n=1 Tax=Henriciella TaxID=453849 RepID=UPI003514350C